MFDNVCKFLAEHYSTNFANWLIGKDINFTRLEPSELSLEPIRADAIILLQSEKEIMHIEFQTEPKRNIPFRMTDATAQSNVTASAAILSGLILDQEVINRILRSDIMKESVIYQEIEAQGMEKGIALGIEQVALNMIRQGMSVDLIVSVTGLTAEKVQQLQRGQ